MATVQYSLRGWKGSPCFCLKQIKLSLAPSPSRSVFSNKLIETQPDDLSCLVATAGSFFNFKINPRIFPNFPTSLIKLPVIIMSPRARQYADLMCWGPWWSSSPYRRTWGCWRCSTGQPCPGRGDKGEPPSPPGTASGQEWPPSPHSAPSCPEQLINISTFTLLPSNSEWTSIRIKVWIS